MTRLKYVFEIVVRVIIFELIIIIIIIIIIMYPW